MKSVMSYNDQRISIMGFYFYIFVSLIDASSSYFSVLFSITF